MNAQKMEQDRESTFRAGITGGVNINSVDGRSFTKDYSFNYQVGGFLLFNPFTKIGFQPEVLFAQHSATYSNDADVVYDDLILGGDQAKAKLNVLKLNALLNFDIGPSQRVKLQLGPQYSILINQETGVEGAARDLFRKGDIALVGGLWLQLPVLVLGARYEHGFSNLNNIDNKDTWRSRSFQIFTGITF